MKYCVIIIHDGRDYLERTLESFKKNVLFKEQPYILLVDDSMYSENEAYNEWIQRVVVANGIDARIVNTTSKRWGTFGSVQKAWDNVPKECEYIFHLENDFTFNEKIDISRMENVLENKNIFQVALLRQAWFPEEIKHGGIYQSDKGSTGRYRDAEIYGENVVLHKKYFTFNPCIYRRSIINHGIHGCDEYSFMQKLRLFESTYGCSAFLGTTQDKPLVHHIGYEKV